MSSTRIMMLEGANGLSFFLREILLSQGVAQEVDLVRDIQAAIDQLQNTNPYDLLIVNLEECWETGLQLGYWCRRHQLSCPVLVLVPPDVSYKEPDDINIFLKETPLSLHQFAQDVREVLVWRRKHNHTTQSVHRFSESGAVG